MQRPEIKTKLTEVFRQVFFQPALEIGEEMTAANVKNWDSLNHVTMIYAVEKTFRIKFSTREVQSLQNIGELITLIERKTT